MKCGKTVSGIPALQYGASWYCRFRGIWQEVKPVTVIEIPRLEFLILSGNSPERLSRELKRHCEIVKRRHELFMKVARGEIEEFTQEDILGSESDE